jgi:heme/copper-type cytochrome/quinol oxidase subunit 2
MKKLWVSVVLVIFVTIALVGYALLSNVFQPSGAIPEAPFTSSPQTVYTNETITFKATAPNATNGSTVKYMWDFGDGNTATGITTTHAYADNGSYIVRLSVTSDDCLISSSNTRKTVLNRPPTASFIKNFTAAKTGELIQFDASASDDLDGTIVNYFWDFGDGNNASGEVINYTYVSGGVYTITLTVTDDDGEAANVSLTRTVLIASTGVVREFAMTAKRFEFNPKMIEVNGGDTVRLTITGLDDGIGDGHGLAIAEFGMSDLIREGQTTVFEFVADRTGTFTYYCYRYCGAGHSQMTGTLVVK